MIISKVCHVCNPIHHDKYICSNCGHDFHYYGVEVFGEEWEFCPKCGTSLYIDEEYKSHIKNIKKLYENI